MLVLLIKIGLVLIAWYEIIFLLFPYVIPITSDTRVGKIAITLLLALAISLFGIHDLKEVKCQNKFLSGLLFISLLSIYIGPKFPMQVNGVDVTNSWMWISFARILILFFLFVVLSSVNISRGKIRDIFNVLSISTTFMAIYVIFQKLGFEQYFNIKSTDLIGSVTNPNIIGNLGQSTIVAPFLGLGILTAIYLKKFIRFVICLAGMMICMSLMVYGAVGLSFVIFLILRSRINLKERKFVIPFILISLLFVGVAVCNFNKILTSKMDNGRFARWAIVIENIKHQKIGETLDRSYPFTGAGLNSFHVIHSKLNDTGGTQTIKWSSSHNVYVDILYCLGFIGLVLTLGAIWHTAAYSYPALYLNLDLTVFLLSSFFYFILLSCGSFAIFLSPYDFIFVLITAFLHNPNVLKGEIK